MQKNEAMFGAFILGIVSALVISQVDNPLQAFQWFGASLFCCSVIILIYRSLAEVDVYGWRRSLERSLIREFKILVYTSLILILSAAPIIKQQIQSLGVTAKKEYFDEKLVRILSKPEPVIVVNSKVCRVLRVDKVSKTLIVEVNSKEKSISIEDAQELRTEK